MNHSHLNPWHRFLQQQGATLESIGDAARNTLSFSEQSADYPALLQQPTLTPLIHLGIVSLQGPDAKKFIQGQITCDVDQLGMDHSLTGARCNPKGRALTSFQLIQISDDQLFMVMDQSLVQSSIDELSKYAAFFKVELNDASEAYHCIGLNKCIDLSEPYPDKLEVTALTANLSLSSARRLLIFAQEQIESVWNCLQPKYQPVGTELWVLQDIKSGIANIQLETSTLFVPQMFNLQAIDGISFKKGCYTGQEVVARMKYLGKLKRRMYRLSLSIQALSKQNLPAPGSICQLPDKEQSIGNIVSAAHTDKDTQEILVVLTEEAAKSTVLIIDGERFENINYLPLPYDI